MTNITQDDIRILGEALTIESVDHYEGWLGFEWPDVHAHFSTLRSMVVKGLLDVTYSSRSTTCYRVSQQGKDAYENLPNLEKSDGGSSIPANLFDVVAGHDPTKNLLTMAVGAVDPVHVLLVGEPASGKSLFLGELARLPNSRLALGGTSSRAGIVDFLIEVQPQYLIIDEIEKADQRDLDVLLTLMENGHVTRLKRGMQESITLTTWVFAGANSTRRLSPALLSRFVVRRMPPYDEYTFAEAARAVLIKRENLDPKWADAVVAGLAGRTTNPRKAVQVARLLHDIGDLDSVISMVFEDN